MSTIVAVFDNRQNAEAAERDLLQAGFTGEHIQISDKEPSREKDTGGFWNRVKDYFGMEDQEVYAEAARRGGKIVTVTADDPRKADWALEVMQRHDPIDIDERAKEWQKGGWKAKSSAGGDRSIPVVEEQLKVGKRQVGRGGVRVYSHVTEKPVELDINLREETVQVQRRPVNRPANEHAFKDQTVEVTETREEPVISKEARVVEEVVVGKQVKQRTEHVRDTVRRTEVDVQPLDDDQMRQDYERSFASQGVSYEDYKPACVYGLELASNQQYQGKDWSSIEPQARQGFEQRYPGRWNKLREAVHQGYDRARSR